MAAAPLFLGIHLRMRWLATCNHHGRHPIKRMAPGGSQGYQGADTQGPRLALYSDPHTQRCWTLATILPHGSHQHPELHMNNEGNGQYADCWRSHARSWSDKECVARLSYWIIKCSPYLRLKLTYCRSFLPPGRGPFKTHLFLSRSSPCSLLFF